MTAHGLRGKELVTEIEIIKEDMRKIALKQRSLAENGGIRRSFLKNWGRPVGIIVAGLGALDLLSTYPFTEEKAGATTKEAVQLYGGVQKKIPHPDATEVTSPWAPSAQKGSH